MDFAPKEADLKNLGKKGAPIKPVPAAAAVSTPLQKGTRRQQEIALRRREADPLAVRVPVHSSYFDNTNTQRERSFLSL